MLHIIEHDHYKGNDSHTKPMQNIFSLNNLDYYGNTFIMEGLQFLIFKCRGILCLLCFADVEFFSN